MSEPTSVSNTLLAQTQPIPSYGQEQFLRFSLDPQTSALLPLQYSVEVLHLPGKEIVPIFFMPAWVTGVYNLRGEILWIVDLGHLLGLAPCYQQVPMSSSLTTIVLNPASNQTTTKARNQLLGCIVRQLEAIEYCHPNQIQSPTPTHQTHRLLSFLQGYWSKSEQEKLAVLNMDAIVAAMPKPEV